MICPHLKFGNQGNTKVELVQVVSAILYRLKTGCQWRELPMKAFFDKPYNWKTVYHHFQKWSKDGSWEKVWQTILSKYKHRLDMSCVQLDGTHTIAKRGGEQVGYQGRKKNKTTNMLIMTDAKGIPICCSKPISGEHNDAYKLVETMKGMVASLQQCNINTDGVFLNADAGFDTASFREYCRNHGIIDNIDSNSRNGIQQQSILDELLYRKRFVVERTNAWVDGFKSLAMRYETNSTHWKAMNVLAFLIIFIKQL
jgi:transposase